MSYNWTIISLKKVLCYTLLHPLPQSLLFCVLFGLFQFFFNLIFNYEFWTKCTVSRISKVNYENVYIFGIKLFNFIIFSTHQIWDLDSTKIQISTVLFVIVANIFHFDYQYTFTAPNIANPRLISSTSLCFVSVVLRHIYMWRFWSC